MPSLLLSLANISLSLKNWQIFIYFEHWNLWNEMKFNEHHCEFRMLLTQITFFFSHKFEKSMESLYNNFTHIKRSNLLEQMLEVFVAGHWRFAKLRFAKIRAESWTESEWQTRYRKSVYVCAPRWVSRIVCCDTRTLIIYARYFYSNKMSARIAANWFELIWYNLIRFDALRCYSIS